MTWKSHIRQRAQWALDSIATRGESMAMADVECLRDSALLVCDELLTATAELDALRARVVDVETQLHAREVGK